MQSASGSLAVGENAPIGSAPILNESNRGGSIAELYARLSNGAPVPQAIRDAVQAHASAAPQQPTDESVPPPPSARANPKFYYSPTGEQSWFQSQFCTQSYAFACNIQNGDPNPNNYEWQYTQNFDAYALVDSSNTSQGVMREYLWNTSVGLWQLDFTSPPINPGTYWHELWWNTYSVYRSADIQGISGPTGLAEWARSPTANITYTDFAYFQYNNYFPNDKTITETLDGVNDNGQVGGYNQNASGGPYRINSSYAAICTEAPNNPNPQTLTITGNTTGQQVFLSMVFGHFNPSKTYCPWGW
jgi:hypothetical protein